jgi:predicted O-methyltransferase YrrM
MTWNLSLSTHEVSKIVWKRLFGELALELTSATAGLLAAYERLEADRAAMTYKTGSIAPSSGIALYALTRKISPRTTFEVGTFIGRSATAMLMAMDQGGHADALFYTCDLSNDFVMDTRDFKTQVRAMPRTGSTDALRAAVAAGRPVDLFHFDGRLQHQDFESVNALSHERTVFALDDFEGIEKGVVNALLLKQSPRFAGYFLIEPPGPEVLAPLGFTGRCLTALLVPTSVFNLVPQ